MKKIAYFISAVIITFGTLSCSNTTLNTGRLMNAAGGALTALTLSDAQVAQLSHEAVAQMDAKSPVAPANNPYTQRLNRLTSGLHNLDGLPLNFKVYLVEDINAFATGDGSIRVFKGLMDIMEDNELIAIIGHELGHVVNEDTKHAMRNAYLAYAAREAIGSTDSTIGALTDSQLGDIAVAYTEAQYSQKQEYTADDFGFEFSTAAGYSPYSMSDSLQKLVKASGGAKSSLLQNMFSSHPDSAARAERMKERADEYAKTHK